MNYRDNGTDMAKKSLVIQVLEILERQSVLRPRDLEGYGIPRNYLARLHERGLVNRVGRGLYMLPRADITSHHTLVEASQRVPKGVICLLSALHYHGLTTQAPFAVWLAIDNKAHQPRVKYPLLRIVRFSGQALTDGVQEVPIEGVTVKIYSPAKTVADCFKYRHKIGVDIAIEALKDCRRQKKCTVAELWQYAEICRVTSVIKPYLEVLS
jgi:predicted transcriptional regulator of viral defense system